MFNNNNISIHDEHTLVIITPAGFLRLLAVPFQVRCIVPIYNIKDNTLVNVDAVYPNDDCRLLYKVLNQRIPYNHFQLLIT